MMSTNILQKIKRGDTFYYYAQYEVGDVPALSELRSQVRTTSGELLADAVIETTSTPGMFKVSVLDTSLWPLDVVYTDIRRESASGVETSATVKTIVEKEVTV
jgi:hypothetical protein